MGTPAIFPDPEGDISLSPNGQWFANGYKTGGKNYYVVYRRSDGVFGRSEGLDKGSYGGDIRTGPAPRWNRTNDAILVPGIAKDNTRQMIVIRVVEPAESPSVNPTAQVLTECPSPRKLLSSSGSQQGFAQSRT